MKNNSMYYSLEEAAKLISVSRFKIEKLCYDKAFPYIKLGKKIRIEKEGFSKWMEATNIPQVDNGDFYTINEAAEMLSISRSTMLKIVHEYTDFPVTKIGKEYRIYKTQFQQWADAHYTSDEGGSAL